MRRKPEPRRKVPKIAEKMIVQAANEPDFAVADDHRRGQVVRFGKAAWARSGVSLRIAAKGGAAAFSERARRTARIARQADKLAEFHERLIEISRTPCGKKLSELLLNFFSEFHIVKVAAKAAQPASDSSHVTIQDGERRAIGDAQHGARRVVADAGKLARGFVSFRKMPFEVIHDESSRAMEEACPAIVT